MCDMNKDYIPSWKDVIEVLAIRGWELSKFEKKKKEFRRRNEILIVFKKPDGHWNVEYFVRPRKLDDSTGPFNDEKTARIWATEMGFLR